ncbi:subclass B3 metallo-beta-lactamase [Pseudoxanthomonas sp.]|uniref:subclass B3 metallo-beta-lactamase n=1 Tax=Pseudoxanthomonas sp. TaxID=1871049 RepID=UPI003F7E14F9
MKQGHEFPWRRRVLAAVMAMAATLPALADDPPEWSAPVKPFRIAGNIHYVGTQGLAAYLITTRDGAILLDATLAQNAGQIERNIESLGVPLREVKLLLSDHAHADHVGAMAQLKRDTGARFLASEGDRWALENGRNEGDNNYGVMPFEPIPVDEVIHDGQTVRLGEVELTAHLTPGHTRGCTSWSMTVDDRGTPRRVLFLCSITVAGNTLVGNKTYPGIAEDYRATFAKLAALRADIVLTSHPEMADVLERAAKRDAGKADAFVEPGLLSTLVPDFKAAFEKALKEQEAAERP